MAETNGPGGPNINDHYQGAREAEDIRGAPNINDHSDIELMDELADRLRYGDREIAVVRMGPTFKLLEEILVALATSNQPFYWDRNIKELLLKATEHIGGDKRLAELCGHG